MKDFLDIALEYAFEIVIEFGPDRMISAPLPGGARQGYTPPHGGIIRGPRLQGIVVPHSGADYALVRPDGVIELNAHYMLQASDGTPIYIANRGYIVSPPETGGETNDQGMIQPRYFRCIPTFRVPAGPHEWLASTVFVAAAERRRDPDHTIFRYYAVR